MRYALAAILAAALIGPVGGAAAQDIPEITIRPDGRGAGGDYVGPYGRSLPGVSMFAGRAAPVTPTFALGGVKLPSYRQIPDEYTYINRPLPILDEWHGTLSRGIPF